MIRKNRLRRQAATRDGFDIDLNGLAQRCSTAWSALGGLGPLRSPASTSIRPEEDSEDGINKSRFFLKPDSRAHARVHSARPTLPDNPSDFAGRQLRADRGHLGIAALFFFFREPQATSTSPRRCRVQGDDVYPLERADVARARELARETWRREAILHQCSGRPGAGQLVKPSSRNRLEVDVKGLPLTRHRAGLRSWRAGEPGDIALGLWQPSDVEPYAYLKALEARYIAGERTSGVS